MKITVDFEFSDSEGCLVSQEGYRLAYPTVPDEWIVKPKADEFPPDQKSGMKISEIIENLQSMQDKHGDLYVFVGEVSGVSGIDHLGLDPEVGIVIETES